MGFKPFALGFETNVSVMLLNGKWEKAWGVLTARFYIRVRLSPEGDSPPEFHNLYVCKEIYQLRPVNEVHLRELMIPLVNKIEACFSQTTYEDDHVPHHRCNACESDDIYLHSADVLDHFDDHHPLSLTKSATKGI